MKRTRKRLSVDRQTLRRLAAATDLRAVHGGTDVPIADEMTKEDETCTGSWRRTCTSV